MAVLIVLFGSWLLFRGIGALGVPALATWQDSARYALATMFAFTGVAHFTKLKHDLARMVPRMFPWPMAMVYITGVLELLGAAGLLLPRFRTVAGLCLIALLVAMFPANMRAAFNHMELGGRAATPLWLRAPMQLLFIGLLLWSTKPLDSQQIAATEAGATASSFDFAFDVAVSSACSAGTITKGTVTNSASVKTVFR